MKFHYYIVPNKQKNFASGHQSHENEMYHQFVSSEQYTISIHHINNQTFILIQYIYSAIPENLCTILQTLAFIYCPSSISHHHSVF